MFKAKTHFDKLVAEKVIMQALFRNTSILLEVDRRYGNGAICIK